MAEWVLVGAPPNGPIKVFGPFAEADDARDFANLIGLLDVAWSVVALQRP